MHQTFPKPWSTLDWRPQPGDLIQKVDSYGDVQMHLIVLEVGEDPRFVTYQRLDYSGKIVRTLPIQSPFWENCVLVYRPKEVTDE